MNWTTSLPGMRYPLARRVTLLILLAASSLCHAQRPEELDPSVKQKAEQGDAAAQLELGLAYGRVGTKRDSETAVAWLRKAAEQGNAAAQFQLATMYEARRGVSREGSANAEAHRWYSLAAAQDHAEAAAGRDRIWKRMMDWEKAEAEKLLQQAQGKAPDGADPTGTASANASATPTGPLKIIPSEMGDWETMWRNMKTLETICVPCGNPGLDQALKEKGFGRVTVADMRPSVTFQRVPAGKDQTVDVQVLYTDPRLIKTGKLYITIKPVEIFKLALYDAEADGIIFNPLSSFCDQKVFSYAIEKVTIARLIGYLLSGPAEPGPWHQRAWQARRANQPFQAMHYAISSYEAKEPIEKAELVKLWAWHTLDFPKAQQLAHRELNWFIKKHGDSAEARELLASIEKKLNAPAPAR